VVLATCNLFRCNLFRVSRKSARSSARKWTGSSVYRNREFISGKSEARIPGGALPLHSWPQFIVSKVQSKIDQRIDQPARLRPSHRF
jgi:hypothetical protein